MISRPRLPLDSDETTRQLADVWEHIDCAVTIVTPEGRITYANSACASLYGYTRDELVGQLVDRLIATEDESVNNGTPRSPPVQRWEGEVVGVNSDGRRFYAHLTRGPVYDRRGHLIGHAIVHRDIGDEVQTRDLLLISAETQIKGANESAAIVKLGWIANSSLNVREVYGQYASELRRLIDFDRLAIWGVNDDQTGARALYVSGIEVPGYGTGVTKPLSKGDDPLVRSRSARVYGHPSESESGSVGDAAHEAGLHSMIAVPLIANNSVVAIMVLRSKLKDAYSNQDLATARRAGMQIAGAIANSQLYDTARQEAEQRRGLAEIGRIVSSSPRIEDVYEQFAERVGSLIPYDRLAISLFGSQPDASVCAYVLGADNPGLRPGATVPRSAITRAVVDRRSGVMTHEDDEDPHAYRTPSLPTAVEAGLRSFLAVPLISLNEVIGVIHICSATPNAYRESDLRLAERIAGQVSGAIANSQLYMEHLLMEGALRESEDRYRMLVENANDAIVVIRNGDTVYRNEAWQRMLGHDSEEAADGNFFDDVVREDRDRVLEFHRDLLKGVGAPSEYEMRVRTRGGGELILEAKPRVVRYRDRDSVMVVMRDVTERKRLQEQLFQAQKMDAIGQLAGGVAHDFNNLLSVILGFSELAHANIPAGDDSLGEHLEEIQDAAQRGARLTRQLLTFSRSQVIEPQVLDINRLVEDLDNMLSRLVKEDIEMVIEPSTEPCMVSVDPGQLEQVIVNLVVNARDAMPDGGRLHIMCGDAGSDGGAASSRLGIDARGYVAVTVSDTGIGMPDDVMARIFEPFFTTKEVGKGTGLGLSTSYGIVKQSGGIITVDSQPGVGTSFRVYLPKADTSSTEPKLTGADRVSSETDRTLRVLLAEDEPSVRTLIGTVLKASGYEVIDAVNGAEALELAQQRPDEPIDLLVTDVVMPKIGGRRLAAELRKMHPAIKVLYVSGYPDSPAAASEPVVEDSFLLEKPFSLASLKSTIQQVLNE